jgi:hypothetical protein
MSVEPDAVPATPSITPVTALDDQRALQILSTEHWSLLSARSLAYNEAFTRGGMFLSFLSMSFVGLALLAQATGFGTQFLTVGAVVLAFDLVIGLATYARIWGANSDDLRAVHGMARIRHGYTQIAPIVVPYLTTPAHDDIASVLTAYGPPRSSPLGNVLAGLTSSLGLVGLITSMVAGVLTAVAGLLIGVDGSAALMVGLIGGVVVFVLLLVGTLAAVSRGQTELIARFPAPESESAAG